MLMKAGERWHCTNLACRSEVFVESESKIEGDNPRCTCGTAMKKNYKPPVFRYLDFLRIEETAFAQTDKRDK